MNGLVQRMTRSGLIRNAPDPGDKRVQRIFLTERGNALRPVTIALEEQVNAWALAGFSGDERVFFTSLLTRAMRNVTGK